MGADRAMEEDRRRRLRAWEDALPERFKLYRQTIDECKKAIWVVWGRVREANNKEMWKVGGGAPGPGFVSEDVKEITIHLRAEDMAVLRNAMRWLDNPDRP